MNKYDAQSIRNACLLSHGGVGKTSLLEALSFTSKGTTRLGKVSNGTSIYDSRPDEKERKMTLSMALGFCEWKDTKLNFLDTPGFLDLVGDVNAALTVTDAAIVLVDAVSGIQVGTEIVLRLAGNAKLPILFFINGMDKENANFETVFHDLQEHFKTSLAPIQIPIGSGATFAGVVDLVSMEAYSYPREGSGTGVKIGIPAHLREEVEKWRVTLMEAVAETDEALMNVYFDKGTLSAGELKKGIAKGMLEGTIQPLLCGSALQNMGTDLVLDAVAAYCPPASHRTEIIAKNGTGDKALPCKIGAPLAAFVFKTISEEHIGEFNLVRVFGGKLATGVEVQNCTHNIVEKPGNMYFLRGHDRVDTTEIAAGDIGALLKLKSTHTNDTLAEKGAAYALPHIPFPIPLVSVAITPKTKGDEDKLGMGINKLHEEDPSFSFKYHSDIRQELLSGMGDVHIDMILDNLKRRFKVEVDRKPPKISYRETVTKVVRYVDYTHKKQSGGAGQYGRVAIDMEPLPRGTGYEFVDKIVGGVIDQSFRPSVDKGIRTRLEIGILAGYPIVDLRVILVDGKTHPVDSKDIAFQIAGREAFKLAFEKAGPILLEPIVDLHVSVPEKYTGDVMGDLSSRRGKIAGMDPDGSFQRISAKVPEAEIQTYSQALRSITQGRGFFTKSFSHYDPVPGEQAKKIIESSKKDVVEHPE